MFLVADVEMNESHFLPMFLGQSSQLKIVKFILTSSKIVRSFYKICKTQWKKRTHNIQHCVKVLVSLVDEEKEVVGDLHLEDLVGVLLLELRDQGPPRLLDEPEQVQ